ncbi:two-component response regulator [Lachnospiraceae bacterium KM106-2]|nr:two-component response regulator [Lachnospiraceae bacterium KM106-2]
MRLLIVEDDAVIAAGIEYSLQQEGFTVTIANSVASAREQMKQIPFDFYLLDLSLPDGTGYEICKEAKKMGDVPVIFLTAVDDEGNVVMGLDMGADDYITKPFRIRELVSRIKSVLRRYGKSSQVETKVQIGTIEVFLNEAKVYKEKQEVILTAMEYRLLLVFIKNIGKVLSRNQLLEGIWDVTGDFVNDNTLTVYIKRLREKLEEDPQNPTVIKTVRGLGYIMEKQ